MDTFRAFGLTICSDFPLPGMLPLGSPQVPDVEVALAEKFQIDGAWSGSRGKDDAVGQVHGGPLRVTLGRAGDNLVTYADHAVFHIAPSANRILCCPRTVDDPQWQRELLDTVLWLTALAHGREVVHASAVEGLAGVIAIVARTGGGKTSLAAELVRRGNPLFCDDVLVLDRDGDAVRAHPAPPLMNVPTSFADDVRSPLGRPLARIDDEIWTAVGGASEGPREIAAICLLERRASTAELELAPIQPTAIDLLPHMFTHPFLTGRDATAFLTGADLLATTPVWRLRADTEATPEALADLISELPGLSKSPRVERVA